MKHLIEEIISKYEMPKAKFAMIDCNDDRVQFENNTRVTHLEETSELIRLVNKSVQSAFTRTRTNGKTTAYINVDEVYNNVVRVARDTLIEIWKTANKKKNFRRTQLSKDIHYARSYKFQNFALELYLDAVKYGAQNDTESKPITKFIAAKFQAAVEAECPR